MTQVDHDHQSACMHPTHKYQALTGLANLLPHILGQTPDPVFFHGHWSRLAPQRLGADSVGVGVCVCVCRVRG